MRATTAIQTLLSLGGLGVAAWAVSMPLSVALEAGLEELPVASERRPLEASPVSREVRRAHALFGLADSRPTSTTTALTPFPARLLGTLRSNVAGRSAAALAMANGRVLTVWQGDVVLDAQVDSIERDAIWLRRGDRTERLSIRGAAPAGPVTSPVTQLGATDYAVSRQAVLGRLSNLYALSSSMRIVPAFREGVPIRFRYFATKPDPDLLALGLQNGDVIRSINGTSLESIDRVLGLASSLLASPSIDLQLERAGQLVTHHYRLD